MTKSKKWIFLIFFLRMLEYVNNHAIDCDFEQDHCSWSVHGFRRTSYIQHITTGKWYNQKHNSSGRYYLDATNETNSTLESKETTFDGLQCLTFLYRIVGSETPRIQVFVKDKVGDTSAVWKETNTSDHSWFLAAVEIDVQYRMLLTIIIRGNAGKSYSNIGIDNIFVKPGSCLDCTNNHGVCNWDGNSVWDMTRQVQFSAKRDSACTRNQSMLTSKSEIYPGQKCLSFVYSIRRSNSTYVRVILYEGVVLSNYSKPMQDNASIQIYNSIQMSEKSRITINFVHERWDCYGHYYIGTISLKQGLCPETTTTFKEILSASAYVGYKKNTTAIYMIIETTTATKSANINASDVTAGNVTTTTKTNPFVRTNESAQVEVSAIVTIGSGCAALIVIVFLVAVSYYRRRKGSITRTDSSMKSKVSDERHSGVFNTDNSYQNISSPSGEDNIMTDRFYYNAEPEYLTIE